MNDFLVAAKNLILHVLNDKTTNRKCNRDHFSFLV